MVRTIKVGDTELALTSLSAIKLTSESIEKYVRSTLQKSNVTFSQGRILVILYHSHSESISLKELKTLFRSSQQTVAGLISRLEEKTMVVGFYDAKDKRVKRVMLTEKGKEVALWVIKTLMELNEELTESISPEKEDELVELLWTICENAEQK